MALDSLSHRVVSIEMYIFRKGKIAIGKVTLVSIAFILGSNFESVLSSETKDADAQPTQTTTGSQMGQSEIRKRRPRKRIRSGRRSKCLPESSESKKFEEKKPATMEAPALILDPTDREPGPPKEIIPKSIDPAEMPSIKKPPKKKTEP